MQEAAFYFIFLMKSGRGGSYHAHFHYICTWWIYKLVLKSKCLQSNQKEYLAK